MGFLGVESSTPASSHPTARKIPAAHRGAVTAVESAGPLEASHRMDGNQKWQNPMGCQGGLPYQL